MTNVILERVRVKTRASELRIMIERLAESFGIRTRRQASEEAKSHSRLNASQISFHPAPIFSSFVSKLNHSHLITPSI
jgi:hypothetical protein